MDRGWNAGNLFPRDHLSKGLADNASFVGDLFTNSIGWGIREQEKGGHAQPSESEGKGQ